MTSSETPRLLSPFSPVSELPERRFAERLGTTSRPKLAEKKIKKILATVHPSEVLPSVIEHTMNEFGLGNAEAGGLKTALWDQALEAFLIGGKLAEAEVAYLRALRRLFWPEGRGGKEESAKSMRAAAH